MALLLLLWLHLILNKSSFSINETNLCGLKGSSFRKPVRLHHRIKTHISHDGQATSDAGRPPSPTDQCPNYYSKELHHVG